MEYMPTWNEKIRLIALLLFVTAQAWAEDIRGHSWGDSSAAVKKSEQGTLLVETVNSLLFVDTVDGLPVEVFYQFLNGRLVSASYFNIEPHTNKNDFIEDYRKLNQVLTGKYGKPKVDKVVWSNELYKGDPSSYGLAVSVGHLLYRSEWKLEHMTIVSVLKGEDLEVSHQVAYSEVAARK
jgi:hypothetical protein